MPRTPDHNVTLDECREIALRLMSANGQSGKVVADIARARGYSKQFVYELAGRGGWKSNRKRRSDAGGTKPPPISDEQYTQVAKIKMRSTTMKYVQPMSSEVAIDIAEESGIIPRDVLRPHHLNRWMRERGVDRGSQRRPLPRHRRKTPYPNFEHQLDTSACQMWYMKEDALRENYRGWRDPAKTANGIRIFRYGVVDHNSGWFYFQYYPEYENWVTGAGHLFEAWTQKRDPEKWPCCGVPERLYVDAGAFKAQWMHELCNALGVELMTSPGSGNMTRGGKEANSAARGLVEVHHWIIEREFETRLWLQKPKTLADLQEKAYKLCIMMNGVKEHSRHGRTRSQKFLEIPHDKLRLPPADFQMFMSLAEKPKLCKLWSDMTFTFKGNQYEIAGIPVDLRDSWVEVKWSPYSLPNVRIKGKDGHYYEAHPLAEDADGWYENAIDSTEHPEVFKDTSYEYWKKKIMQAELPELKALPDFEKRLANLRHIPREGAPVAADSAPTRMPFYHALQRIHDAIARDITIEENAALRAKYNDWMTEEQIDHELNELQKQDENHGLHGLHGGKA